MAPLHPGSLSQTQAGAPGDVAYIPEGIPHRVRAAATEEAFTCLTQITPPPVELYEEGGFYHRNLGVMNFEACFRAALNAKPGTLKAPLPLQYRETEADLRA